ncbi:hypothetical protein DFH28DRAFT_934842 [Melampsora americana]|nr:hypothetical protein DFH28DRAFT_934842 [Melampsora americana]
MAKEGCRVLTVSNSSVGLPIPFEPVFLGGLLLWLLWLSVEISPSVKVNHPWAFGSVKGHAKSAAPCKLSASQNLELGCDFVKGGWAAAKVILSMKPREIVLGTPSACQRALGCPDGRWLSCCPESWQGAW